MKRLIALLLLLTLLPSSGLTELWSLSWEEEDDETQTSSASVLTEEEAILAELDAMDIDTSINPDDLLRNERLPGDVVNILLIGIDSRAKDLMAERTSRLNDVNIVLSINTRTGELRLTSILRDIYLTLPRWKSKARLNTAFSKGAWDTGTISGGALLTLRTINYNFQLNIEHYVLINFYGVAAIVDALGGLDIEMTASEAKGINSYLHNVAYQSSLYEYDSSDPAERTDLLEEDGVQHCDGVQALLYARVRNVGNDFDRTQRQRNVLELLMRKVTAQMSLSDLVGLMQTCLPYVYTNMNASRMLELALAVVDGLQNRTDGSLFDQHRIPLDHAYSYATLDDGSSVIQLSFLQWRKNRQSLHEFIYGTDEYLKED